MATEIQGKDSPRFLLFDPQEIVAVRVEATEFKIYKSFLTRDSDYFQAALKEVFPEGQTQKIELGGDIKCTEFGVYVDSIHREYFGNSYSRPLPHFRGMHLKIDELLSLWKCSDRFLNDNLKKMATQTIERRMAARTPEYWEKKHKTDSGESCQDCLIVYQKLIKRCVEEGFPFQECLLDACSNIPPQLFNSLDDTFDAEFLVAVSKKLVMHFADLPIQPESKHPATDNGESPAAKRLRAIPNVIRAP